MARKIDITGMTFNSWRVVSFAGFIKKKVMWNCVCICGKEFRKDTYSLRNGMSKSCGCVFNWTPPSQKTHGMSGKPIYNVWRAMKMRCENQNDDAYERYGGRGIKVSDEWKLFSGFYKDMGESYNSELTLERDDVNGDYCKSNCRWASYKIQARNKRNSVFFNYKGKVATLPEFGELYNIPAPTLHRRIRVGWSVDKAIETPLDISKRNKIYKGIV